MVDTYSDTTFIIKQQETGSKDKLKEVQQALTEIQYLKMIRNTNVVRYRGFEFEKKQLYLLMEYCDGGNLEGLILRRKETKIPFEENEVWEFLIQIIHGIKGIHDFQIVHRDLKSANIARNMDGTLKICDFNVSKRKADGDFVTDVGNQLYMAPEIFLPK